MWVCDKLGGEVGFSGRLIDRWEEVRRVAAGFLGFWFLTGILEYYLLSILSFNTRQTNEYSLDIKSGFLSC